MLTKNQLINRLAYGDATNRRDPDVAFAANVILTQQRKPVTRLRGLLAIIEAGENDITVSRDGQLYVNGNPLAWPALELPLQQIADRVPLRFKVHQHNWAEQPGEPACDVCTSCGEVRY